MTWPIRLSRCGLYGLEVEEEEEEWTTQLRVGWAQMWVQGRVELTADWSIRVGPLQDEDRQRKGED